MRYTVRSADGEVSFGNYLEMEQAWLAGLVDPEDEVHEEGKKGWYKAGTHPLLVKARPPRRPASGSLLPWIVTSLVAAMAALFWRGYWGLLISLPLALILSALLTRLAYNALRPNRKLKP